jgi:hypothetical protein
MSNNFKTANINVEDGITETFLNNSTDIAHPWAPQKKCSIILVIFGIIVALSSLAVIVYFWNVPDALLEILIGLIGLPFGILSTSAGSISLVVHYYPVYSRNIGNCFGCCSKDANKHSLPIYFFPIRDNLESRVRNYVAQKCRDSLMKFTNVFGAKSKIDIQPFLQKLTYDDKFAWQVGNVQNMVNIESITSWLCGNATSLDANRNRLFIEVNYNFSKFPFFISREMPVVAKQMLWTSLHVAG